MSPTPHKAALVIGHPGHELRVLGWLKDRKPLVLILTDDAGHGEEPRTDLSRSLVAEAGAKCGDIFGQVPDQRLYRAILELDFDFFLNLSNRLAASLELAEIDWVAGDSVEGYNPAHDLCRSMIDRAVRTIRDRTGRNIDNFQFPLVGHPAAWSAHAHAGPHRVVQYDVDWFDATRQRHVPLHIYAPESSNQPMPVIIFSHGLGNSRLGYS